MTKPIDHSAVRRLLSLKEAASELGVSYKSVWQWAIAGHIAAINISPLECRPCWRVSRSDLDAFVKARMIDSAQYLAARREEGAP